MSEARNNKYHTYRDSDTNPCVKEGDLSTKCLENQNYDHTKCTTFFNNYMNCRRFWNVIYKRRKAENIKPYMPNERERNLIKNEREKGNNVIFVNSDISDM